MTILQILAYCFLLISHQDDPDIPCLETEQKIRSQVTESDPVIVTATLTEKYDSATVKGERYSLKIDKPGEYTITMRSFFFDSYLVLRKATQEVLIEDDDGLYGVHSRIIFRAEEGN